MKREIRLYNVILPVWLLWLFPQVWLIVLPGNLLVDGLVLLLTLLALKRRDKKALVKALIWKFWIRGFAADFVGAAWMFLGALLAAFLPRDGWWQTGLEYTMHNPFGHPAAFCWTLAAAAIAAVCIYRFDRTALKEAEGLTNRERHVIALAMAIVTAPWTFFIPVY